MNIQPLLYRLTPIDPTGHRLQVHVHIAQPDPNGQQLSLPTWIPGSYLIRDFSRNILTLQARSGQDPVAVHKVDNHTWHCAPCQGPLDIEYTLYAWDLSVRSAHVDESHAFFNGTSTFLMPHGHEHLPCRLELCPPPHTRDWRVYTSLPPAPGQRLPKHGFGHYQAPDYDALIDHPVEMGTPAHIRFDVQGAEHELVFTGVIPNLDLPRIAQDVKKICAAQMALFEPDAPSAPFLDAAPRYVFMTLVTEDGYGGLEHRASTALMTSRRSLPTLGQRGMTPAYQDFLGLVSHEYFHTWHVKRIKPAAFAPYDLQRQNFTRLLWVFEGFTSYYDDLMLLRAGLITQDDYLKILARTISNVHLGSGRHKQSVADSSFDAWTRFYKQDENAANAIVSYYSKGALVALGLDLLIRQQSHDQHSLDDVMRLLWQQYGKHFYQGQARGLDETAMPGLIQQATGVDVTEFLDRYVYGCEDIPLAELLATQGIQLAWETADALPSFNVRTRSQHGHTSLAVVYENGAAHQAGLSAGDVLVAIDGLKVGTEDSLKHLLTAYQPGDVITVHVFRRDELRQFDLTLAAPAASQCTLTSIHTPDPETPHESS